MTYDNEGRFRPQNFEDIFAKYDKGNKGGLTWADLLELWKGQRMVFDFFGWSATFLECKSSLPTEWSHGFNVINIGRGGDLPPTLARGWYHAQRRHSRRV